MQDLTCLTKILPTLVVMIVLGPIILPQEVRFLQTMREISSEHNTTTFLLAPIDLFTPFLKGSG